MSVKVTRDFARAIEDVRSSGVVNMLDRPGVVKTLQENGDSDVADWVTNNKKTYARLIFEGIEIDGENETDE